MVRVVVVGAVVDLAGEVDGAGGGVVDRGGGGADVGAGVGAADGGGGPGRTVVALPDDLPGPGVDAVDVVGLGGDDDGVADHQGLGEDLSVELGGEADAEVRPVDLGGVESGFGAVPGGAVVAEGDGGDVGAGGAGGERGEQGEAGEECGGARQAAARARAGGGAVHGAMVRRAGRAHQRKWSSRRAAVRGVRRTPDRS